MSRYFRRSAPAQPGRIVRRRRSGILAAAAIASVVSFAFVPKPAQATTDPVYSITAVTRAWFYTYMPDLTSCESKWDNPLLLDVQSTVENPVWDGQVSVKGLKFEISSGDRVLGTVPLLEGYLSPGGDPGESFLTISCRSWNALMAKGFGGRNTQYGVRIVGPGQAFDTNDGSPAGTVEAPDTPFSVTVRQLVKHTDLKGSKAGGDVKISTALKAWAKHDGKYSWRPLKGAEVDLLKLARNRYRQVDSARSTNTGGVTLRFAAGRENYVEFRVPGYTFNSQAPYFVTKNGDISFAGR